MGVTSGEQNSARIPRGPSPHPGPPSETMRAGDKDNHHLALGRPNEMRRKSAMIDCWPGATSARPDNTPDDRWAPAPGRGRGRGAIRAARTRASALSSGSPQEVLSNGWFVREAHLTPAGRPELIRAVVSFLIFHFISMTFSPAPPSPPCVADRRASQLDSTCSNPSQQMAA